MEVTVVRVVWLLVSTPLDHTSVLATMVTTKLGKHALPMNVKTTAHKPVLTGNTRTSPTIRCATLIFPVGTVFKERQEQKWLRHLFQQTDAIRTLLAG